MKAANHTSKTFSPALATLIAPFLAIPNQPGRAAFQRYTLPARELRRALYYARAAGAPFYLEYSHLPDYTGLPGAGSGHAIVAKRVRVVNEDCYVLTKGVFGMEQRAPCEAGELGLLPPPPLWARKLMLAWPYPLLEGELESQGGLCFGE
jgi:hypothetical protein